MLLNPTETHTVHRLTTVKHNTWQTNKKKWKKKSTLFWTNKKNKNPVLAVKAGILLSLEPDV